MIGSAVPPKTYAAESLSAAQRQLDLSELAPQTISQRVRQNLREGNTFRSKAETNEAISMVVLVSPY
jgi:hypothetical protein